MIRIFASLLFMFGLGVLTGLEHGEQICESTSMLSMRLGCVGDWISGGFYCHRFAADGTQHASRAY